MATNANATAFSEVKSFFDSLKAKAKHVSKKKNLDLVWQVLEAMRAEGLERFTVSEVARRLEPLGGPKTQSLRNTQGAEFRALIEAYEEVWRSLAPKAVGTQLETAIAMIPDPSVRVVLKEFFAENKRLKHENDQLRSAFKNLSIGSIPTAPAIQEENPVQGKSRKTPASILKGLNPSRLKERGLQINKDGSVEETASGTQIFPPGFITAIAKAFDHGV